MCAASGEESPAYRATPAARLDRLGWCSARHPASQPGLRTTPSLHLGGPAPAPPGAECAQRAGAFVGLVSGAAAADPPGEISLKDLWAYQSAHQAAGHAAGTINRRLDYLLGILRELAEHDLPVDNSVFRLRPLPRPASLPRHLTEAESQRLETFLAQRHTAADPVVRIRERLRVAAAP